MTEPNLLLASSREQMEKALDEMAILIQSYYDSLIKAGMPYDLARELITDYHSAFWYDTFERNRNTR